MERIIHKLKEEGVNYAGPSEWSLKDLKELLEIYHIISEKESEIFAVIYRYHGCDSWEDVFRDYNRKYLEDKADGVQIAIDALEEAIKSK